MRRLSSLLVILVLSAGRAGWAGPSAEDAWVRVLPGNLPLAGYLRVHNPDDHVHTLVGAESEAFDDIEIHQSQHDGNGARMIRLERVKLPAGADLVFAPNGRHLMLFDRRHPLSPGGQVHITLHFADGTRLDVPFALRDASGR